MKRFPWILLSILSTSTLIAQSSVFSFDILGEVSGSVSSNPMGFASGDAVEMTIEFSTNNPVPFLPGDSIIHASIVEIAGFAVGSPGNRALGNASGGTLIINEAVDFDSAVVREFSTIGSTAVNGFSVHTISMTLGRVPGDFLVNGNTVPVATLFDADNWNVLSGSVSFRDGIGGTSFIPYTVNDITFGGQVNAIPEPSALIALVGLLVAGTQLLRRRR